MVITRCVRFLWIHMSYYYPFLLQFFISFLLFLIHLTWYASLNFDTLKTIIYFLRQLSTPVFFNGSVKKIFLWHLVCLHLLNTCLVTWSIAMNLIGWKNKCSKTIHDGSKKSWIEFNFFFEPFRSILFHTREQVNRSRVKDTSSYFSILYAWRGSLKTTDKLSKSPILAQHQRISDAKIK